MLRNRNWFFGRHFVIVYPIFDFFWLYFGSFGLLHQWPAFHPQIHSGKYFPELTTNGSAEGLDHLSVKGSQLGAFWPQCTVTNFAILKT